MLQPEKEEIRQKHDIFIMNRDESRFVRSLISVFLFSLEIRISLFSNDSEYN